VRKKCGTFELAETTARYRKDLIEMSRAFHVCLDVLNERKTKMFRFSQQASIFGIPGFPKNPDLQLD
ncbi:MAG: hypothetical protein DMF62_14050, partial [Acidobacteria bacterium]